MDRMNKASQLINSVKNASFVFINGVIASCEDISSLIARYLNNTINYSAFYCDSYINIITD